MSLRRGCYRLICWCWHAHTRACAQGLREPALAPPLRGPPQFPGPAGPRPGGAVVFKIIIVFIFNVTILIMSMLLLLYYTMLYYNIPYHNAILCYKILYYATLHDTTLYFAFNNILYYLHPRHRVKGCGLAQRYKHACVRLPRALTPYVVRPSNGCELAVASSTGARALVYTM